MESMRMVISKDGIAERYLPDKVTSLIQMLIRPHETGLIDVQRIEQTVMRGMKPSVTIDQIMALIAESTAQLSYLHPIYDLLAGRIEMKRLNTCTATTFSGFVREIQEDNILSREFVTSVKENSEILDSIIDFDCDERLTFFNVRTLQCSYLLKKDGVIVERPQYMYMRVAVALHGLNLVRVAETYSLLSRGYYVHASPTLYHAGTVHGQLSSCFLKTLQPGSVEGIYNTLSDCAKISSNAGGIGLTVNDQPSIGSRQSGSISSGLPSLLRLFDASVSLTMQGDNKRPGAITVYIEPWHPDIYNFIDMKRNRGSETLKARKLFYGLWIPDIFMRHVQDNALWSLFDPNIVKGLASTYGRTFEVLYEEYETDLSIIRTEVKAQDLWRAILECQIETGGPFILYKDSINRKSNQKNLGTITHSNLCTEIVQFSSLTETAVCNLASINLPAFVENNGFNFSQMRRVVKVAIDNLNRVIDCSNSPDNSSSYSNKAHRAVGLGIQGLADTFIALRMPYNSSDARSLNKKIAQTLYFAAVEASIENASLEGAYHSYNASPAADGMLQPDLWDVYDPEGPDSPALRMKLRRHGLANSLLIALMPTAGTSQITGSSESFEPILSNVYTRRVMSGEYQVLSSRLVSDLSELGLWNEDMRVKLMASKGSVQMIESIPNHIKEIYRTAWEIGPRAVIEQAVDRSPYVCQSQSMSIYMEAPSVLRLSNMHFYGWRQGLKTGMYYLRTRPASEAIPFTLPVESLEACLNRTNSNCEEGLEDAACQACSG